jgi:hypothetical protein
MIEDYFGIYFPHMYPLPTKLDDLIIIGGSRSFKYHLGAEGDQAAEVIIVQIEYQVHLSFTENTIVAS